MSDQHDDGGLFVNATLRDWLVGQALTGVLASCTAVKLSAMAHGSRKIVNVAEATADEYLRRRKERHDTID